MIHLLSADHRTHGLDLVAHLGAASARLGPDLCAALPTVRGAIVLATCNRLALLLDADDAAGPSLRQQVTAFLEQRARRTSGTQHPQDAGPPPYPRLSHWGGQEAVAELFATAAGLESMVVGEREIAGQLRRAHLRALQEGTTTGELTRAVEHASATSRRVSTSTSLAGNGRSVVAVGLDLAAAQLPALECCRVLLVGTGAYAGATATTLRERGVQEVEVYSRSERAAAFAAGHGLRALPADALPAALARADLVITCRGLGVPVISPDLVAEATRLRQPQAPHKVPVQDAGAAPYPATGRPLVILDLALQRDVDTQVAALPGVTLIDLAAVQQAVPAAEAAQVRAARAVVAQETQAYARAQQGRRMGPVIRELRQHVDAVVQDEVSRLRPRDGLVDAQDAERALHHLAARLLHHPSVAAREAGRAGRQDEYLAALSLVLGLELDPQPGTAAPDPAGCPDLPTSPGDQTFPAAQPASSYRPDLPTSPGTRPTLPAVQPPVPGPCPVRTRTPEPQGAA